MKQFLCIACALECMVFLSCVKKDSNPIAVPSVFISEVRTVSGVSATTFTGKTKAVSEVNLAFRVAGQIERILVKEGDYVKKGQIVAKMDNRDYVVQLAAARAEYQQVKADAERVMALYKEGNVTASNYDKARYGLQQIAQKLKNCENKLADTELRSSVDGYVQTKFHEAGETVGEGMSVLSVFESGKIEVEIKVSSSDFVDIEKINNFYCSFESTGKDSFPLRIARVNKEANASQLYVVRLMLAAPYDAQKVTPGMTAMVYAEIPKRENEGNVCIPSSSILYQDAKTQVFVYRSDLSTIHLREIKVQSINRDGTMLVEGVKAGENIVLSGVHHLKDGQKVKVLQKPSPSNVGGLL